MTVKRILATTLSAIALASTAALPAAAHGAISHGEMYYDYVLDWGTGQYNKVWMGEVRYYCDGHVRTFGSQIGEVEYYYGEC